MTIVALDLETFMRLTAPPQSSPTPQADSQPALDRDRIREIFMEHGFTVKEGQTDLKQYVYDAADALLRAARAPADNGAAPATQQAGVVRKIDRGFRWDGENLQHVPTLLLEFEPVPANSPCDAKGWQDRDAVADRLSSPTAQAAESVLEDAGGANWQDISTAPKDGTRFVAVGQNYGLDSEKQHTCIAQRLAGCWVEVSDWNGASKLKYLTHWMPLPPLPGSAARAPADSQPAVQQVDATRAAARALSDRFAEMCNVDKEDHWQWHSDDVLSDAELVVSTYLAARAPADSVLEDTEMLDFLEQHPEMSLRHRKGKWAFVGFTNYEYEMLPSLREAIRAARKEGDA